MHSSFRVLIAEIVCVTLIVTQLSTPVYLWADESHSVSVGASIPLVSESGATSTTSESGQIAIGSSNIGRITPEITSGSDIHFVSNDEILTTHALDRSTSEHIQVGSDIAQDQILISFKPESLDVESTHGKSLVDAVAQSQGMTTAGTISEQNIAIITLPVDSGSTQSSLVPSMEFMTAMEHSIQIDQTISRLKNDPRVSHVQKNFVYKVLDGPRTMKVGAKKFVPMSFSGRSMPNDASFSNLWGLDNQGQSVNSVTGTLDADIDYPEAIAYASGRLSSTGTIVAVLDTGVDYTHPDLAANMWDGRDCISDSGVYLGSCEHGYDFAYDDRDPLDHYGHGTHVSGTIGAVANNGTGITGVAPRVQIMAVKVLSDNGGGNTADIIRGINFARNNGARVINASFGGMDTSVSYSDFDFLMYNAIRDFPGLFIAAAGNNGSDNNTERFFPAEYGSDISLVGEEIIDREVVLTGSVTIPALGNVIAVASTDSRDQLSYFSNYGTGSVHIAAPGENIYSTFFTENSVSGEVEIIGYENGWNKKGGAAPQTWAKRNSMVVSGETADLSGVLWGDTRDPYVSGESSYIQKSFTNTGKNITNIALTAWCDTPSNDISDDRIDILISTGTLFTKIDSINTAALTNYGDNTKEFQIDGHTGTYASYRLYQILNTINTAPDFEIRLKWVASGSGTSNYGCFLRDISLDHMVRTEGYEYHDGTSMATPHVTGAVALAMSFRPDLNDGIIKSAILATGDHLPSLDGKIMTSSRLNVLNMLQSLETPKILNSSYVLSGEAGVRIQLEKNQESLSAYVAVANNKDIMNANPDADYADRLVQVGILPRVNEENEYHLYDTPLRAEVALFLGKLGGYSGTGCTGTLYLDVTGALDECGYIENLARRGIFDSGSVSFNPDSSIERAEEVRILLKSLGYTGSTVSAGYTDTSNVDNNTLLYINQIHALGCDYYGGTEFYPNAGVSHGELYHIAACVMGLSPAHTTKRNTYFPGYQEVQNGTTEVWSISDLAPDTIYYYSINACTQIMCNETGVILPFRSRNLITQSLSGASTSSTPILIKNATATGVTFTGGTSSGKIILINTGTNISVEIPTQNLNITASGAWDGMIHPSETYTGSNLIMTTSGTVSSTRIEIIGSTIASLALSGQLATIKIPVVALDGTIIPIYRADTIGQVFTLINSCTIMNNICSFTTDHFSAFALGIPIPPAPSLGGSGGGSSNISVGAGGGGASSSSSTIRSSLMSHSLSTSVLGNLVIQAPQVSIQSPVGVPSVDLNDRNSVQNWVNTLMKDGSVSTTMTAIEDELQGSSDLLQSYESLLKVIQKKINSLPKSKKGDYIELRKNLQKSRSRIIEKKR